MEQGKQVMVYQISNKFSQKDVCGNFCLLAGLFLCNVTNSRFVRKFTGAKFLTNCIFEGGRILSEVTFFMDDTCHSAVIKSRLVVMRNDINPDYPHTPKQTFSRLKHSSILHRDDLRERRELLKIHRSHLASIHEILYSPAL